MKETYKNIEDTSMDLSLQSENRLWEESPSAPHSGDEAYYHLASWGMPRQFVLGGEDGHMKNHPSMDPCIHP